MKNFKKYVGVIVFSAVAMTAIPVSGSFVRPAVVKAEDTYQAIENADTKLEAVGVGYDKVEIKATEGNDLTQIFNDGFRFGWTNENELDASKAKTVYDSSESNVVNIEDGKISIPGWQEGTPNLALVKLSGSKYTGTLFTITREAEPAKAPDLDKSGNFETPSEELENLQYKRVKSTEVEPEKVKDDGYQDYSAAITVDDLRSDEGDSVTYLFRKKGSNGKLPSTGISITNPIKKVSKEDITTLTFQFDPITCEVSVGDIGQVFGYGEKRGSFSYEVLNGDSIKGTDDFNVKDVDAPVKFSVKEADKFKIFVKDSDEKVVVNLQRVEGPGEAVKAEGNKIVGFGDNGGSHLYKKNGAANYVEIRASELTDLEDGEYDIVKQPDSLDPMQIKDFDSSSSIQINSLPKKIRITAQAEKDKAKKKADAEELAAQQAAAAAAEEAAKKAAEEAKKTEEAKKEDPKKEEPKKDDTKTEAPKTEEPKTEEPKAEEPVEVAPVDKTVSSKKASATVSAEDVAAVTGELKVQVKGATLALPKAVLSDGAVKVSLKAMAPKKDSKDAKALTKNLKKNKLEDKKVYSLSVKSGKKNVKGKFTVELKTTLKKAPKKLYVMNIANGKLMKAKFKKGMVTFTAEMTGKFVVVSK